MFTGIVEEVGKIINLRKQGENLDLEIEASFASELKIDQSVAHNGVCLTVVDVQKNHYRVTAIKETLDKTSFSNLKKGDYLNLERGMKLGDRLDGHIVQGHVDQTATCTNIEEQNGSWLFSFGYDASFGNLTIEKGSITINGVSLTVVNSKDNSFCVAIIPYTHQNTTFSKMKKGDTVNLEFDVIGKYVKRLIKA